MSRSKRKPYHHGNLREALLRAARRLVEAEGPEAVSFRKLADAVDVSHAAPLAHFPDRLSLEAALAAEGFREVRDRCEQLGPPPIPQPFWEPTSRSMLPRLSQAMALPPPPAPRPPSRAPGPVFSMQLVTAALVHLRFALEHPGLYRVMYASELAERLREESTPGEAGGGEEPFRDLAQEKARAFAVFVDLVRAGQEAGEFRTDLSPDQAARLVTALAEGLARQYLEEGGGRGVERLRDAEGLFELLVRGLHR
ncbi:MAG: TetR/AcrR family transcriptional regulator [Gemmatimonadales bacterium]